MRRAIGWAVFGICAVALGPWGAMVSAPQIEAKVRFAADAALAEIAPGTGIRLTVSGRDITVSGLATNAGGSAELDRVLMQVQGRRVVRSTASDLPIAKPFVLTAQKQAGGAAQGLAAQGFVPNDAVRAQLSPLLGGAAQGLTLASGAPEGWAANAVAGLAALSLLQSGKLTLEGQTVILVGEVVTAADLAAVDMALSPVKMLVKDVAVLDDGLPVSYTLTYSATDGARLNGKLPFGGTPESFAVALGLPRIEGDAKTALIREMGDMRYLSAWAAVLPQIETLSAEVGPGVNRVRANLNAGADVAAVTAALQTGGFLVDITAAPQPVQNGEVASETPILDQVLPAVSSLGFDLNVAGCQGASDTLLAQTTIIFLPNLAELDASAQQVLTDLAAIARDCASADLRAEIGGHTDTSGDAAENQALSARRAEAVRATLIAAAVPEASLSAKGYGASMPISENETKEGRIKNRRTTVVWRE